MALGDVISCERKMTKFRIPKLYFLEDVPEVKRYKEKFGIPTNREQVFASMYGRAIHWMSFLKILWPDFEELDHYLIEVAYIVIDDPDDDKLPKEFYQQVAEFIGTFWRIQLEDLYPNGDWEVIIDDDPEMTVEATIHTRE